MLRVTFSVVALLALPAVAGEATYRPASRQDLGRIGKLLPGYLWDTHPKRRPRYEKLWEKHDLGHVTLTQEQFAAVAGILRGGHTFTTEKRRSQTLEIPTGEAQADGSPETLPVRITVTGRYKPGCGLPLPLIITLHGGPQPELAGAQAAAGTQLSSWAGHVDAIKGIVAAPAVTGEEYSLREWTLLENLIEELDRQYCLDRDRILLTGHSWGGILTWHLGPPHADRFAALAPFVCAVNPGERALSSCRNLPIYSVQGKKDIEWILRTGRERIEVLEKLGYEHVYREKDGGHSTYTDEIARIAKWFMERPRRMYATELVRASSEHNPSDLWYWVRSEDHTLTARIVDRHTVEVDCHGDFEVFLADEMVDLDAPVIIRRDGETVFEGSLQRRLDFTLAHLRETGDRGRIFAASVRIQEGDPEDDGW